MKVLFVQLSDLHCTVNDYNLNKKISKVPVALKHLGNVDHVIVIISGDLSENATKNEFKTVRHKIHQLISAMSKEFNCGYIRMCMVPGNHDIILKKNCRGSKEILSWHKDDIEKHIDNELGLMTNFFEYANSKRCFLDDKICDNIFIDFENLSIQLSLLNSAPFSTRENDNKELHHFPASVGEKLHRADKVDIKLSIMHHHYEWCDWNTKEMLREVFNKDDIVFFGHDHKAESIYMKNGDGNDTNIVMGGRFDFDETKESTFNAVVFDSDTSLFNTYTYFWDTSELLFKHKYLGEFVKKSMGITPNDSYVKDLLKDNQHPNLGSFMDRFVVPKISVYGSEYSYNVDSKRLDATDIFEMLFDEQIIRISGAKGSGKTTLLKYLYIKSIEKGYVPLFLKKRKYNDKRFDKILKDMFEDQYSNSYDCYEQFDHSKEIVLVDDWDLVNSSDFRSQFAQYVIDSGRLLILTVKDIVQDIETVAKERMKESEFRSLVINPFYKETRDELVYKIGDTLKKSEDDIRIAITGLDYLVQCQARLFTSSPSNLIQYILFFFNQNEHTDKGANTLSLVFETNIHNSLLNEVSDKDVTIYLSLLEFLAGKMFFDNRSERIGVTKFEDLVKEFNAKRMTVVNAKIFLDKCIKAQLLKNEEDSFDIIFNDNNIFAYFVAKYINSELERDSENTNHLMFVLEHICFGINDTIILFLSYIKSNIKIVLRIVKAAENILKEYPEWNIEENNLGFLSLTSDVSSPTVTESEKKEAKKQTEFIEKERHDAVKFNGIFDYSEASVNQERYRVLRALKFTQIVGRALVDQFGSIDASELQVISEAVYKLPQKIIYAVLREIDVRFALICVDLEKFAKKELPDKRFTEDDIKQIVADSGLILAMNILNDIAYNCSNKNTLNVLSKFDAKSKNHEIMLLMMQENGAVDSEFIDKVLVMYKNNNSNAFIKNIINMIVRKHIMFTLGISNRHIDKLLSAITAPTLKRSLPSSKQTFPKMSQVSIEKQSLLLMKGKKKKD